MSYKIRVISLDRIPWRFEAFVRANPNLPAERVSACDGSGLDIATCVRDGLFADTFGYRAGEMGCAVSHIILWQECAGGSIPFHIAEDDAIIRDDFFRQVHNILSRREDWDIVLWTYNYNWPVALRPASGTGHVVLTGPDSNPAIVARQKEEFQSGLREPALLPLASAAGIGCYSISPKGAARMLDACLPLTQQPARYAINPEVAWINSALDVEMSRYYEKQNAWLAYPPLALMINDESVSTIRGSHCFEAEAL
ncbi:glycosyltransferase family 25 protein [Acetobacter oeni]|uniref:Glycosyl transferase family 25 domain-containing protein n=1 Tax=Acetobacter oeni TaxID=304077 RepID=A0A511XLC9_9PROT|nr:glycosyltransferase family 25 protein [Acetobacter oeni]MBB3883526.1 GR25 family glycosyltransferase involved in LPS biosynthesis [Acetobacter oeni]NHO19565.1 hypothetical protein [Acetobacter oeni]GBR03112.1 glycosyltransferase [Acetobacter oeni LMG 21952]GEN63747.1 hypothetical protein AOE01nite_19710 [Acetobacter oeni]